MAQTAKQKALAAAKAQIAKTQASLEKAQAEQRSLAIGDRAMDAQLAAKAADAPYSVKVGTTGLTQAQLDAQTNAVNTAKEIGGTLIANPDGPGVKVVAPTAPVVKKKIVVDPNEPPDPNDPVVDTYTDSETGDIYNVHKSGKRTLLSKGTKIADAAAAAAKELYNKQQAAIAKQAEEEAAKRDAFALIQDTMRSYGFDDAELQNYLALLNHLL
jgi:hypothetical protein